MKATRTCATPNCGGPRYARDMCQKCYGRAYRAGEIQPTLKIGVHSLSEVDTEERTAVCSVCGPVSIRVRRGRGHECMTVRRLNRRSTRNRWGNDIKHKYGLTMDEYAALWLSQDGQCAICGDAEEGLHVDHSHETGEVRGLLCRPCNLALGFFRDDPRRIGNAATYLISREM